MSQKEEKSIESNPDLGVSKKSDSDKAMKEQSDKAIEARRESIGSDHAQRMLDTVLEHPPAKRAFKQTMMFDLFLGFGLLIAVAGFTTGLMKIYLTHMAKQSINQHDYKAAIHILNGSPVPQFFSGSGGENNPSELLNQALYLDAVEKLEADHHDQAALSQLMKIPPGSRYFSLSQQFLKTRTKPSEVQLEGSTFHLEKKEVDENTKLFEEDAPEAKNVNPENKAESRAPESQKQEAQ